LPFVSRYGVRVTTYPVLLNRHLSTATYPQPLIHRLSLSYVIFRALQSPLPVSIEREEEEEERRDRGISLRLGIGISLS
jgi:hypothetical protein